jgi:hypothetical protein
MTSVVTCPWYLTSDAAGVTLEGTGPTTIVAGTDGFLIANGEDSVISGSVTSEADGDADFLLTIATVDTYYLNVVLPDGSISISGAITFTSTT